jgi:hypothetical protein
MDLFVIFMKERDQVYIIWTYFLIYIYIYIYIYIRIFSDIRHVNGGNPTDPRTGRKYPNELKFVNPRLRLKDRGILSSLTKLTKFN